LGYQVEPFSNPIEALAFFRQHPSRFDLVIADMTMPKMTGDEFLKRVMELAPGIPTVICTGYNERIDESRATELGIQRFLMKPVKMNILACTIRDLLDEKRKEKSF
jgi:CheY-like chemotaxis protein